MNYNLLTYITWNVEPAILQIGNFKLLWYSTMWATSIIVGYALMRYLYRKSGFDQETVIDLVQYVFFGGVIGARLGDVLFYNLDFYMRDPIEILKVWHGGLASHGGVIGVLIAIYLYSRSRKEVPLIKVLDLSAIVIPLLGAFIRIGNLFNSELYGKVTDVPWAFVFTKVDDYPRHPSQLYETLMLTGVFAFMMYLFHKKKDLPDGFLLGVFFVLTFGLRALLEFFKVEASYTQLLSIPLVIGGLILIWLAQNRRLQGKSH
ncbi:MAG: prolipoprotein diacylglyceryl transferase [Chitinophagales bacterium]